MSSADTLELAMHRMSVSCAAFLEPESRVLDVGCGLGGTARIMSRLGHEVLGIDSCPQALRFARQASAGVRHLRFEVAAFPATGERPAHEQLGRGAFDALVMLEVLQHFDDLDAVLATARELTRPGGTLVLADLSCVPDLPRERVPYHREGALLAAAQRGGWTPRLRRCLTDRVKLTPERVVVALQRGWRDELRHVSARRPEMQREIDELSVNCEQLHSALRDGALVYELTVLQRR